MLILSIWTVRIIWQAISIIYQDTILLNHEQLRYVITDNSEYKCDITHYKCPGYYCIPWRYVCDKKIDCPGGLDERKCPRSSCPGQFKCMESDICVSRESLCDTLLDCPSRDDEEYCSLSIAICPKQCICLLFALYCQRT